MFLEGESVSMAGRLSLDVVFRLGRRRVGSGEGLNPSMLSVSGTGSMVFIKLSSDVGRGPKPVLLRMSDCSRRPLFVRSSLSTSSWI